MDELRSSEALEREIRDDSRKKAERILRQAEEDMAAIGKAGAERAEREISLLRERYREKADSYRAQTLSRLPLERKRKRIEWAQKRLESALSQAVAELDADRLLGILVAALRPCAAFFAEGGYSVTVSGLDPRSAASRLEGVLPGIRDRALRRTGGGRALRVESGDGRTVFSMDEAAVREMMADKYRFELSQALLGKMEEL